MVPLKWVKEVIFDLFLICFVGSGGPLPDITDDIKYSDSEWFSQTF